MKRVLKKTSKGHAQHYWIRSEHKRRYSFLVKPKLKHLSQMDRMLDEHDDITQDTGTQMLPVILEGIRNKVARKHNLSERSGQKKVTNAYHLMTLPGDIDTAKLIVEDGQVKGFVNIDRLKQPSLTALDNIYIAKPYRRQGIGSKVISSMLKDRETKGVIGFSAKGTEEFYKKQGAEVDANNIFQLSKKGFKIKRSSK